jgi:hypothetical protein
MSSTTLYRLSGICLLVGSVLAVIGAIIGLLSGDPASTMTVAGATISLVGGTLGVLGLPGMYAIQAQRAAILGLIGVTLMLIYIFILGMFSSALDAIVLPFIATHAPALVQSDPPALGIFFMVGGLLGAMGGILLGIAIMRAAVLPRWAGLLLMIGVVLQFVGDFLQSPIANLGFLFVMIAFAWLGLGMLRLKQQNATAQTELPASAARV